MSPAYPPPDLINGTSSWGGSVVRGDDGKYHMFAAEMSEGCGLKSWSTNSIVVHAVADAPMGPFERKDVAVQAFAHNPVVARAPDGTWVLWHIGCGAPNRGVLPCETCSGGQTNKSCPREGEEVACTANTTHVLSAKSLDGPWVALNATIVNPHGFNIDNPAPYFFPNGSVLMLGRDGGSTCRIITAPSWQGPYRLGPMIGEKQDPVEDPFLYRDSRGAFHALFHGGKQGGGVLVSGYHWFSHDGLQWSANSKAAFTTAINYTDGSSQRFSRRERPHLLFDKQGEPTHLFTGLWLGLGDKSATHVQALNTAVSTAVV